MNALKKLGIGLFVGGMLFAHTGYAEEAQRAYTLDSIVVTAEKIEDDFRTGDVDPEQASGFNTRIERKDFEGKTENLAEVIEKEAGIQIRQSGGLGSYSTVSLRGSSSDQVMVFLDGVLLNDASGGGVDLSSIALSDVASIEIYRGVTPVNFGKASIGGVVNIRTLRSQEGFNGSASAGYGSFDTKKLSAFVNYKPGDWDVIFSADYLSAENDFEFLNDNGTEWNDADDRWEDRNNAQTDQHNLLGKAGYDFTDTLRLDLVNQYFQKEHGLPSWNNSPLTRSTFDVTRNITTLGLTADDLTPLHFNTRTQLTYTWKEEEYDDRGGYIGLGEQHSTYTTDRLGADFFGEWMSGSHAVIFTVGMSMETYETEDHQKTVNPRDSSRNSFRVGLQDSLFFMNDQIMVSPAIRYTWIRDELKSGVSEWGKFLEERERNESYLNPQIGVRYAPFSWLVFRTNLARYVREPSFFELFGDRGFFIGNPDLKEEEGVNFDIGAEIDWLPSFKSFQRVSLRLTGFRNEADDLITRVYNARGIGKSDNISGALIQGVEAALSVSFLDHFRAILNATWQDPENQSDIEAFSGKNLPGQFETAWMGRLEARYWGFTVFAEYIHEADMYYDTANLLKAEDKEEFNAGISWLWRDMKISLEAKNLGDDMYEDFNGYPLPGRSFFGSLKYDF